MSETSRKSGGPFWAAIIGGAVGVLAVGLLLGYLIHGGLGRQSASPGRAVAAAPQPAATAKKAPTIWTCSMHPQIRLPKPGLCPICNMKLIPLETQDTEAQGLRELTVSETAKKLMDVESVPVERRFVDAEVRMVGKVDYDETRLKYVTAWVPGRLDRLYVDYTGVPVKKGDHLVYLYSPELLSAQEELLQAIQAVKSLKNSDVGIVRESTEAMLTAAREKLRLLGMKAEQIAEIEQRGKVTDHMTIYSPIGGIVIHKNAQEGMYVQTGTRIYTVADLSEVWIRLDAYESDLMWLRYGQKVEFTTESYPGEAFNGTIAFIDPILTETTRTVKVRVNAPNAAMKLKPGMFVRAIARAKVAAAGKVMDPDLVGKWICPMHPDVVKDGPGKCDICGMPLVKSESLGYVGIDPATAPKPLVIPASAALITGTRAIVYVVLPDRDKPTFEGREIVLGPRAGDDYLVRYGLSEGERVVTRGSFKIDAELQIQAKPSAMTPAGGGGGGGHHHGGMSKAGPGKQKAPSMQLPAMTRDQLRAVVAAAEKVDSAVEAAKAGELAPIRAAFDALFGRAQAVDRELLRGHMKMLWKEYAMLLANDGVEGRNVKTLGDARRVAKVMAEHLASMKAKLGVSGAESPAGAPPVDPRFRAQLGGVVKEYLATQEALAADDFAQAQAHARGALEALGRVDMKLLEGGPHMAWMKAAGELSKTLGLAAGGKDIQALRESFAVLSEQMTAAARQFQPAPYAALYQYRCPMAFNNRGATWLQAEQGTRNPYFGSAMPQCGSVIEVLRFPEAADGPAATQPTVWTCSMHPEVRLPKPGRCPKCNMELIPARPDAKKGGSKP